MSDVLTVGSAVRLDTRFDRENKINASELLLTIATLEQRVRRLESQIADLIANKDNGI